jgi:hypothetical protein
MDFFLWGHITALMSTPPEAQLWILVVFVLNMFKCFGKLYNNYSECGQQEVFEGYMSLAVVVMVPREHNETFH